jgi:hypothetical protein
MVKSVDLDHVSRVERINKNNTKNEKYSKYFFKNLKISIE